MPDNSKLTETELQIVRLLDHALHFFQQLPIEHEDDRVEFWQGIHRLREKVLARPARRDLDRERRGP